MAPRPRITVTFESGTKHSLFLRRRLRDAAAMIDGAPATISVAVVGAATMRELHGRYLGSAAATDVLSFEVTRDPRGWVTEGEIVVCLPVAQREARQRGHQVENELLLYALHGLLHLCGYDDATPAKAAQMHAAEDRILQKIGVGPVFAPRKFPVPSRRARNVAERRASS